jgi:hypothetical protein
MTTQDEQGPLQVDDPGLIHRVRGVFDRAGYTWPGILELLGESQAASFKFSRREVPRFLRCCASGSPRDTLARLFLLGVSVEEGPFRQAIAPMETADWVHLGLLGQADGTLYSPLRVTPTDELLLVQESPWRPPPQANQVMPISGSTMSLAKYLIRRPVDSAVEIGTGCGVLTLLAAQKSAQAIGTDCNPRALNLARFNAQLNRLTNTRFLEGDLFGPVEGQCFDLVIANPPYVISPEKRALYRDSGLAGDEISARMIRGAPRFLRPGGFAQVLINWAQVQGQDWQARLQGWLEGSGCAAWLIRFETVPPEKYAITWLPQEDEPKVHDRRFEEWMAYYEGQGIEAIGSGIITLRRQTSGPDWFAYDDAPREVGPCGAAVLLGFEQRDFLIRHPDDPSLLAVRYRQNPALEGHHRLKPGGQGWELFSSEVSLAEGLAYSLKVEGLGMEVLARVRPDRPLEAILTELAARFKQEPPRVFAAAMPFVRCLIEEGFLLPVASP